jgi:hypothetical protein
MDEIGNGIGASALRFERTEILLYPPLQKGARKFVRVLFTAESAEGAEERMGYAIGAVSGQLSGDMIH